MPEICSECGVDVINVRHKDTCSKYKPTPFKSKEFIRDLETIHSDGSTASYYELPDDARELQHLISFKDMNAQVGEIFRACYRYGQVAHSDKLRDAKKILFYAEAEVTRLEKLNERK